jgi:hypothetical protein
MPLSAREIIRPAARMFPSATCSISVSDGMKLMPPA